MAFRSFEKFEKSWDFVSLSNLAQQVDNVAPPRACLLYGA